MYVHDLMLFRFRKNINYKVDRTNLPADYLLSRMMGLVVDATDVIRGQSPDDIGTAG